MVEQFFERSKVVGGVVDGEGGDGADVLAGGVEEGFDPLGEAGDKDLGTTGALDAGGEGAGELVGRDQSWVAVIVLEIAAGLLSPQTRPRLDQSRGRQFQSGGE